jgi:hypothetical protein
MAKSIVKQAAPRPAQCPACGGSRENPNLRPETELFDAYICPSRYHLLADLSWEDYKAERAARPKLTIVPSKKKRPSRSKKRTSVRTSTVSKGKRQKARFLDTREEGSAA